MDTNTLQTLIDLLKQPPPKQCSSNDSVKTPPPLPSGEVGNFQSSDSNQDKQPTIFDLQSNDRYRILKLIEELLDTQEEADQLKQKLEDQKSEFREKRSVLIKRLDLLSEKHGRALSDIKRLKEMHSSSLTGLEGKISMVSQKFEESASTVEKLRKENSDLKKENLELLKLNSHISSTIASMKEENSKLSLQLKESRHRERSLHRQLKQLSVSEMMHSTFTTESAASNSLVSHSLTQPVLPSNEEDLSKIISGRKGAGDFVTQNGMLPSSSGITTIKAPIKLNSEIEENVAYSPTIPENPPCSLSNSKQILNAYKLENNETIDSALIENLFFRF